jgi:hypothetical protein
MSKRKTFPLPWIGDTLDKLAGAKWFSTLDMKSGFWQVDVNLDDKKKTAFSPVRGYGLLQSCSLASDLLATFERLMETVL